MIQWFNDAIIHDRLTTIEIHDQWLMTRWLPDSDSHPSWTGPWDSSSSFGRMQDKSKQKDKKVNKEDKIKKVKKSETKKSDKKSKATKGKGSKETAAAEHADGGKEKNVFKRPSAKLWGAVVWFEFQFQLESCGFLPHFEWQVCSDSGSVICDQWTVNCERGLWVNQCPI